MHLLDQNKDWHIPVTSNLIETQGKSCKETEYVKNKNSMILLSVHPTTFWYVSGYVYVIFFNTPGRSLLH